MAAPPEIDGAMLDALAQQASTVCAQWALVVGGGGGCDALPTLQLPGPGVDHGDGKQAREHERAQCEQWSSPSHEYLGRTGGCNKPAAER